MAEKNKTGIPEVLAIAVLLLFIWRQTHKKKTLDIKSVPPVTSADAELAAEGFDLNSYCRNIVYRPLMNEALVSDDLIGLGWCAKGDTSMIDKSKGFGDDYADVQAKAYEQMKQDEAEYLKSKYVIQFRLINSGSVKLTTSILNTTQDSSVFAPPLAPPPAPPAPGPPSAPVAAAASGISDSGFTASWSSVPEALGYYLDVAYDNLFTSMVPGYNNMVLGPVVSALVTPIASGTDYYYRVRSFNLDGVSASSNTINTRTQSVYNDYFLPSQDEAIAMYANLSSFSVGGFTAGIYYSSTENGSNGATAIDFSTGSGVFSLKGTAQKVRACRSFIIAHGTYALRDIGPAAGLVFKVVDNGDGTDTVYEAGAADTSASAAWSNIVSVLIGTTLATIGTGKANTSAITSQVGHVTSAAKLCKDLIVVV
jgi:hypothetical protein